MILKERSFNKSSLILPNKFEMLEKPILIVHPNDNSTSFLNRIKNHLLYKFPEEVSHFNTHPNDYSRADCLSKIRSHSANGLIIFLGHGRSDKLFGSKGKYYYNRGNASLELQNDNLELYYNDENFIDENNIDVFSEKKIFCLACNSNEKVGKAAFDKGAKVFLGFGDIPTSIGELEKSGYLGNDRIVKFIKSEVNLIIKKSLEISIQRNYSFGELENLIHFMTNQHIAYFLRVERKERFRFLFADHLYRLKSGLVLYGDKSCPIIG